MRYRLQRTVIFKLPDLLKMAALVTAFFCLQCSSLQNTFSSGVPEVSRDNGDRIFIGLRSDAVDMSREFSLRNSGSGIAFFGGFIALVDLPLSTALDVAFLPYTLPYYLIKGEKIYSRGEIVEIYQTKLKGRPGEEGKLFYAGSTEYRHYFRYKADGKWESFATARKEVIIPSEIAFARPEELEAATAVDPEDGFRPLAE